MIGESGERDIEKIGILSSRVERQQAVPARRQKKT